MLNLLDLVAKITLDDADYQKVLEDSQKKASKFGEGLKTAFKAGGVALAAVTTAVAAFTKKAVEGYAEFEQLEGGIKKLYGNMGLSLEDYAKSIGKTAEQAQGQWEKLERAQTLALSNAQQAYKTTGMSANEYMQNITGFSAALITSLKGNTEQAASVADMAMRDIADNANTFGKYSAQELAQVYQALAKGTYTTLDNLNLGYGGSKEGMQALIKKANELGKAQGKNAKLSINNYADIVEAIHRVQEAMNITGTTEREAATTIQGSIGMARAAWDNLVAGFSNPDADIGRLISNMVKTGSIALKNIVPAVETVLSNIVEALGQISPILTQVINYAVTDLLPKLVQAGGQVLGAIVQGIIENVPQIMQAAIDIVMYLGKYLADNSKNLAPTIVDLVLTIVNMFLDNIDQIVDVGIDILMGLIDGIVATIPVLVEKIPEIIARIVEAIIVNLPKIIDAGYKMVVALGNGIIQNAGKLKESATKMIDTIKRTWNEKGQRLREQGRAVVNWIKSGWDYATSSAKLWGSALIDKIKNGITSAWNSFISTIKQKFGMVDTEANTSFSKVRTTIENIWNGIKNFLSTIFGGIVSLATNFWGNLFSIITGKTTLTTDSVKKSYSGLKDSLSTTWGNIKSTASTVWGGIKSAITGSTDDAERSVKGSASAMGNAVENAFGNGGKNISSPVTSACIPVSDGTERSLRTTAD